MRQIKFRGKRIDNNEWVYGDIHLNKDCTKGHIHKRSERVKSFDIDPATVGQYTGLHDKDGVEIYEGDVVKTKYDSMPPVSILWKDGGFYYSPPKKDPVDGRLFCVCEFTTESDEVIDNIHSNPELIEKGTT